jgi:hypothetical protein
MACSINVETVGEYILWKKLAGDMIVVLIAGLIEEK